MSDEVQTTTADPEAEPDAEDVSSDVEPVAPADAVAVDAEPSNDGLPEWVDRYIVPLVMPLLIVGGLVFYVINVSRMFLATPGAGAVVIAVSITVAILLGATLLAAAPNMRTSSMALVVLGGLLVVLAGGSLTAGESAEEGEGGEFPAGTPEQQLAVDSGNLFFDPEILEAVTGFSGITMTNVESGGHTFVIETPGPISSKPQLEVNNQGDVDSYVVFVGDAGDYVFFCSIPGHREAGMEGVLGVTGDSVTIEEAAGSLGEGGEAAEGEEA